MMKKEFSTIDKKELRVWKFPVDTIETTKLNNKDEKGAFKAFEKQASKTMRMLASAKDSAYSRHAKIVGYQDRILQRNKYHKNTILKRLKK